MKWIMVQKCRGCSFAHSEHAISAGALFTGRGVCPKCGQNHNEADGLSECVVARRRWPWSKWEFKQQ